MAKTEEKPKKKPARPKKGLHGWKAALTVFGCGTLAAFGVFGIIFSLLGSFLSVLSFDSGEESAPTTGQTIEPRETFLDDKFDLCGRTIPSIPELSLNFDSRGEGPVDTSIAGGEPTDDDLVRSDECWGEMFPDAQFFQPWEFRFTYKAVIFSPEGSRNDISRGDVEEWREEVEGQGLDISESGDLSIFDEAYYYYGSSGGQGTFYKVIARKKSGALIIEMDSSDEMSLGAFEFEAQKFEAQISITLENRIPE